jgi:uncharacterized protein YdeI (YjbR/CyaY-like superfamily)
MALEPHHVTHFASAAELRAWLEEHHEAADELWLGFWKKDTGKQTMTWSETVDQVLCFGWIDGVRKPLGGGESAQRLTPRRKGSNWSQININKVEALMEAGLMAPAGIAAFEARTKDPDTTYSYERRHEAEFSPEQLRALKADTKAWAFWQDQPPGYQASATHWVVSAKKQETRDKRMATLIDDSKNGLRIGLLRR